jgi:hypothetical protein
VVSYSLTYTEALRFTIPTMPLVPTLFDGGVLVPQAPSQPVCSKTQSSDVESYTSASTVQGTILSYSTPSSYIVRAHPKQPSRSVS